MSDQERQAKKSKIVAPTTERTEAPGQSQSPQQEAATSQPAPAITPALHAARHISRAFSRRGRCGTQNHTPFHPKFGF